MTMARQDVAQLLAQHGRFAGSYAVLGSDPWQFDPYFASNGQGGNSLAGFTPYLQSSRTVLSWRGPVTALGNEAEALAAFTNNFDNKISQFVIGVDQSTAEAAENLGFFKVWIGTECVSALDEWNLTGGRRSKLRWAKSHAAKTHEWLEVSPKSDTYLRTQMLEVEAAWKKDRKARATDSFLRTALMDAQNLRRHFASRNLDSGVIDSYVSVIPTSARGWYLQDCVRMPWAIRGTLEGSLALACETLSSEGFETASNGILPMYSPERGREIPQTTLTKRSVISLINKRYRFNGLNQFRMKLEPDEATPMFALIKPARPSPRSLSNFVRILTKRLQ